MADSLGDGEFCLPPRFLSDDDLKKRDVLGFHHMGFFSFDGDLSSPSTDNEDFMTGLTSQLARSTTASGHTKGRSLARWPQCTGGSGWKRANGPGQLSLPPDTWDRVYEVARVRLNESSMAPHRKPSYTHPHQRLQENAVWSEHVKGTGHQQVVQNRARNCDFINGGTPGAWQIQANESGTRGVKNKCAGTGVFLPRPKVSASETRKRPGCCVLLPARVVQALNLNLDEMGPEAQVLPCRSVAENGVPLTLRVGSGLLEHPQPQGRPRPATRHDIRLPQEWTY